MGGKLEGSRLGGDRHLSSASEARDTQGREEEVHDEEDCFVNL